MTTEKLFAPLLLSADTPHKIHKLIKIQTKIIKSLPDYLRTSQLIKLINVQKQLLKGKLKILKLQPKR